MDEAGLGAPARALDRSACAAGRMRGGCQLFRTSAGGPLVVGSDTERDVTRAFDITLAPPTVGVTRLAGCSAEVMRSYLASADPSDSRR